MEQVLDRRKLIQFLGAGIAVQAAGTSPAGGQTPPPTDRFPVYLPQTFGAAADGKTLDSPAINAAIDRAAAGGGGVVYLRPGVYLCGTVVLKSHVTLYLEAGAIMLGSKDIRQYTPQPGPDPRADAGQRHLLFARDAEDVTITGGGTIDGQGESFWKPTNRKQMPPEEHWQDVITRDWTFLPRVSPMIELVGCRRLHVERVRIENSAGWTIRIINCDNVTVDSVSIKNPVYGINVDGIDLSNSSNVRISNCSIDTADDAICLKSENPYGNTLPACRNITITNCTLTGCCNGLKFGTRTEGAFENIVFSNSVIYNNEVDLNARIISGICIEMVDGGSVEGVVVSGIRMQRTRTPIFLRLGNRTPRANGNAGSLRSVSISDIVADGAVMTSSIVGIPGFPIEDVSLSNISVETTEATRAAWNQHPVPEQIREYPEARMFGRLPAYGLYCRHVNGLALRDLSFRSASVQETPAIACDQVRDVEIRGLRASAVLRDAPVVSLLNVQDAWITGTRVQTATPALLYAAGETCSNLLVSHCHLRLAEKAVKAAQDVPRGAVLAEANALKSIAH